MRDSWLGEPVPAGTDEEPSVPTNVIVGALHDKFDGHVPQDNFGHSPVTPWLINLQKKGRSVLQVELSRSPRAPKI